MHLSTEEKAAVSRLLNERYRAVDLVMSYGAYLLPTAIFAAYGFIKGEVIALALAYVSLLFIAVWYLMYSFDQGKAARSALAKYEQEVRALDGPQQKA